MTFKGGLSWGFQGRSSPSTAPKLLQRGQVFTVAECRTRVRVSYYVKSLARTPKRDIYPRVLSILAVSDGLGLIRLSTTFTGPACSP